MDDLPEGQLRSLVQKAANSTYQSLERFRTQRVESLAAERRGPPCDAVLTPREKEILALIDDGLSNKQIAQRLFIEVPTVKNHVHNILEKLNVSRRSEAAAQARGHRRFTAPALLENQGQIARGRRGTGVVPAR